MVFEQTVKVNALSELFEDFTVMESVDLSEMDLSLAQGDMQCVFANCTSLKSVDFCELDLSGVSGSAPKVFEGCTSLTAVDLSGVNLSGMSNLDNFLMSHPALLSADLSGLIISGAASWAYGKLLSESLGIEGTTIPPFSWTFDDCPLSSAVFLFYPVKIRSGVCGVFCAMAVTMTRCALGEQYVG